MLNGGVPLPSPVKVSLPEYDSLISIIDQTNDPYYTSVYEELKNGHERAVSTIIHPINAVNESNLPGFITNPNMKTINADCPNAGVSCDLHYELDWSYKLKADLYCETADDKDPCFATYACICDNGYFRIAENMPERPADFSTEAEEREMNF